MNVLPQMRFTPTQKMRAEPTRDKFAIALSVIIGFISLARRVMHPCRMNTGIAEKIVPLPMDEAITRTITESMMAFEKRIE